MLLFIGRVERFLMRPIYRGDWSNGMIGVSKTFGGSSILSSPVLERGNADGISFFYENWLSYIRALGGEEEYYE